MTAVRPDVPGLALDRCSSSPPARHFSGRLAPEDLRRAPTGETTTRAIAEWRSIMSESHGELDFTSLDRDRFAAGMRTARLRDLAMYSIRTTELLAARTRQQASRTPEQCTVMIWQTSGRSIATQGAKRTTVEAGDVVFLDFNTPYSVECVTPYTQIVMMAPSAHLARHPGLASQREPFRADKIVDARLASPWLALLRELCRLSLTEAPAVMPGFYPSALDAIGNLAALTSSPDLRERSNLQETNCLRVLAYIDDHCDDPELNADAIARGVAMSRRTLFRVLHQAGVRLEEHLLRARLDRALALLEAPASGLTIDTIARTSGFRSTSHFHARFLEAHGQTPAQYRAGVTAAA